MIKLLWNRIIRTHEKQQRSNFLWNMIGSGIYSVASMVLTFLTIRILGEKEGGIFSIALTISQMLVYIAYLEMRTYQVTDTKNEFTFKQYFNTKILTCILMLICSIIYILFKGYSSEKALIIFMMCVYRMIDGIADVFESQFHSDGRLDISGKSMAFRTLLSVGTYFTVIALTKNLIVALTAAIIVAVLSFVIFDVFVYKAFGKIEFGIDIKATVKIIKVCFPLFIGVFLWTYILSASRIAVDDVLSSEKQAQYQILFMPTSVINLFVTFFFRPSLTSLSELYGNRAKKEFTGKILKMLGAIAVFTVLCAVGAYILGIPILIVISGCKLESYKTVLIFLMAAGGINAAAFFLYYVLTIMRKPNGILLGYVSAAVTAFLISNRCVEKWGLWGAAISFGITVSCLFIIFAICIVIYYRKEMQSYRN